MATFPDIAICNLLENLRSFEETNPEVFAGAREDLKVLCAQLEMLSDFLGKLTEEKEDETDGNELLYGLAKKVEKLVCRAEDAVDTYISTVFKQKARGMLSSRLRTIDHAMELRRICRELENLRNEVTAGGGLSSDMDMELRSIRGKLEMGRNEVTAGGGLRSDMDLMVRMKKDERITGRTERDRYVDDIVGLKDAIRDVVRYLEEGPDELKILSIVGMSGLGKTTLAKQVLKLQSVESQFGICVFVEVSQHSRRKEVMLKLVRAFGNVSPDDMNRMDENELGDTIRDHLDKTNYLIVLDDVWTQEAWNDLKSCFPNNNQRSRILITTQMMGVAQHAGHQGSIMSEPYMLRFLSPQESKELLWKKVFGAEEAIRSHLEEHEATIINNCRGLPLAIVVVAGILFNNPEERYWWNTVSKLETEDFPIVSGLTKMSFDHLPYRLKPCFLYLGVFPEGSEIYAKTLYQLWVAEGFVPLASYGKETSEDIAESYLEQLVDRSLVMVEKRRVNGRIKTIRIHDYLRKFCKAQSVQEGLFREIKYGYGEETRIAFPKDDRRLCINHNVQKYVTSTDKQAGQHVRSFLSFANEDFVLPIEYTSEIPKAFKLLRVLDVRSMRFTRFPAELYYTVLLKYIAMSTDLKTIPEKFSNLRFLQTLIFHTTETDIEMRADICKMKQLKHLQTNKSTRLLKTKEDSYISANVQTLTAISPESCTPEIFRKARKLKKLGVCGELAPYMELLLRSLSELEFLENLKLLNSNMTVPLKCLPRESTFPRNLSKLTLSNTMLSWEEMSTLARLRNLEVLKLKENAFVGEYWDTEKTGSFTSLKVLLIGNTDLTSWKVLKLHFPTLVELYLKHCFKLQDFPLDLVNIHTLKLIDIYHCNPQVGNTARKLHTAKLETEVHESNHKNIQLKLLVSPQQ